MDSENGHRANQRLLDKVLAFVRDIAKLLVHAIKPARQKRLSAHHETDGICEKKGQFHYIKRGRRRYLVLKFEDCKYDVIIGLGNNDGDAWIRKISTEIVNDGRDYQDKEMSHTTGHGVPEQQMFRIYSEKSASSRMAIKA